MRTVGTNHSSWLRPKGWSIATRYLAYLTIALFSIGSEAQVARPHLPSRVATPPAALISAAESGDAAASLKLGNGFYNGRFSRRDYVSAVKWYTRASAAGNNKAKARLGLCYLFGRGLPWILPKAQH